VQGKFFSLLRVFRQAGDWVKQLYLATADRYRFYFFLETVSISLADGASAEGNEDFLTVGC
jgi:hypothetical protein